ncbi:MAG: restriction endonuclease subunit S [Balneola sp.]
MKSNYKRIGDFIKLVDERNTDLKVDTLVGLSINKIFIPSVANTVGTNMKRYKIIRKNQFACSTMQVRRDKKMPVALLKEHDKAIISQAYLVFQVIDENVLLSEYLMMWMSREEFDRHACFLAVGGVRGSLEWEDFLDMEIPVPSVEKQREIVTEYNAVVNRIKLNERLNEKLEETAQTIYRQWFEEFEFPIPKELAEEMGTPELEGKPYKSSGGEMVYNEELEKEIPMGWQCHELENITAISAGGDKPKVYSPFKTDNCLVPIYSNTTKNRGLYGYTNKAKISEESITISARGAIIGYTVLRTVPFCPIVRLIVVTPLNSKHLNYIYYAIKGFSYDDLSSAQGQLTVPEISSYNILFPDISTINGFERITKHLKKLEKTSRVEILKMKSFGEILTSKMAKVEVSKETEMA